MVRGRSTNLTVELTSEERQILETWQQSPVVHNRVARRGRIILMLAENASVSHTARSVGIQRRFVYIWAKRFCEHGLDGLGDRYAQRQRKLNLSRSSPAATKQVDVA